MAMIIRYRGSFVNFINTTVDVRYLGKTRLHLSTDTSQNDEPTVMSFISAEFEEAEVKYFWQFNTFFFVSIPGLYHLYYTMRWWFWLAI